MRYCSHCRYLDWSDCRYGDYWCSYRGQYVDASSSACWDGEDADD